MNNPLRLLAISTLILYYIGIAYVFNDIYVKLPEIAKGAVKRETRL